MLPMSDTLSRMQRWSMLQACKGLRLRWHQQHQHRAEDRANVLHKQSAQLLDGTPSQTTLLFHARRPCTRRVLMRASRYCPSATAPPSRPSTRLSSTFRCARCGLLCLLCGHREHEGLLPTVVHLTIKVFCFEPDLIPNVVLCRAASSTKAAAGRSRSWLQSQGRQALRQTAAPASDCAPCSTGQAS